MTDVQVHEAAPAEHDSALIRWARDAREAHTIAMSLVKTSFVPQSMRNKPEEAAAAILTGAEIGLTPMAALRSIDVIQGTPAMRAHALRGLVQSRGHEVWVEESNSNRAIVCGRRKGETQVQQSVWNIDRAKALGLLVKENWKRQPQAMLVARATSELCRLIASDVLLGLPYSIEELSDDQAPEAAPVVAKKRTAQRAAAPQIEPPSLDEPTPQPSADPDPEPTADDSPAEPEWPDVAAPGDSE